MKTLKQFLIMGAFVILASTSAFAQKNDDQKKPKPKDNPPVVVVPKDGKKPRENDRPPKKPQGALMETLQTLKFFN
ncbi:MAG TPA: hypothetical protein VF604_15355 [Pyrinomonadaceae bacterium]